jgi:hypothetical protein
LAYEANPEGTRTFNLFGITVDVQALEEQKKELAKAVESGTVDEKLSGLVNFLDAELIQMHKIIDSYNVPTTRGM